MEWFVVPLIVGLAFVVGLLNAVFMGIAISTFIFVAAFFRSGVVKFIATGAVIRSTIERTPQSALWLDENGPRIQVRPNRGVLLSYMKVLQLKPSPTHLIALDSRFSYSRTIFSLETRHPSTTILNQCSRNQRKVWMRVSCGVKSFWAMYVAPGLTTDSSYGNRFASSNSEICDNGLDAGLGSGYYRR